MKTILSPQLSQSPNLTPQLLQSIRMLQLTGQQLEQELLLALETNPLLERTQADADLDHGNDFDGIASGDHDDVVVGDELADFADAGAGRTASSGASSDDPCARIAASGSSDFRVRLLDQLALSWNRRDLTLATWWLDHTDDRGFLEGQPLQLLDRGADALGCSRDDLHCVRQRLLHGELPGVTAATLVESLLAQLVEYARLPASALAATLLKEYPIALESGDVAAVSAACHAPQADVADALQLIRALRPTPVDIQAPVAQDYIHPDVMAWQEGGQWHVALCNTGLPQLQISAFTEQVVVDGGAPALRGMLDEARWLLRGLAMRNDTLLRTARILVRRQRDFLAAGDEAIAPLTLQDVATELGMHESTVSRITSGKYMQTPRGPIELKAFFASRIDGAEVSGNAVRAMVKRIIAAEPAHAPLGDAAIATMLARKGIHVARRTIAKYRDQLNIGSARERTRPATLLTGTR